MKKGFTLIEILIVIGILAILAAIIIIAINPARQFAQARNTQRRSDVIAILNAVQQRIVDNKGSFAEDVTCDALPSSTKVMSSTADAANVDICDCLVETYLAELPYDPLDTSGAYTSCSSYHAGYTIYKDASSGRITVAAPSVELSETISVTR